MKTVYQLKKRNAFTLVEIALAMVLMTFVLFLAGSLLNLGSISFTGSEIHQTIVREDSAFAAKLNKAIQESTVSFTVPKNSFNDTSKLTAGWNYLGVMENVHIPKAASRTGKEIASAQALVYIEYAGDSAPGNIPSDCNVIHNSEGYFIQKILGHAFTDHLGTTHAYSLEFKPTNPNNTAAQTIIYEFSSDVTSHTGEDVGSTFDIGPMLSCLNAIQVVYKGGHTNPATALAFRSDFMPTWSAQQASTEKPAATVIMVLDTSGSMRSDFGGKTRTQALRERVRDLVEQLSVNEKVNVLMAPFSTLGGCYNGIKFFNLGTQKQACLNYVGNLSDGGSTNPGDGLRMAYLELNKQKNSGVELGSIVMILMTDGDINTWSYTEQGIQSSSPSGYSPYNGIYYANSLPMNYSTTYYMGNWVNYQGKSDPHPNYKGLSGYTREPNKAIGRRYTEIWATTLTDHYTLSKSYLISLASGMNAQDKALLERIFGTEAVDVNNLTEFQTVFEDIGVGIEEVMWAFEGPNL